MERAGGGAGGGDDLDKKSNSGDLLEKLSILEKRKPMDHGMFAEAGWQTVRQLGSGSHGRCYLMKRPDGSLLVHKRVPVSHMLAAHQELAEREVNILAAFSHPYIIRYDRAFVRQGQLCIAMEHAAGGDLAGHVRGLVDQNLHPSVDTCLDWFVQLLLALEYVHGYKVLHRDIALKNVFLAEDGTVKLGDFGVARILSSTQELAMTKVGTPCYIAPERVEGKPYSYEADVWSMGCLLFELLTLRPAFSADTIPAVSAKILAGAIAPFETPPASHPVGSGAPGSPGGGGAHGGSGGGSSCGGGGNGGGGGGSRQAASAPEPIPQQIRDLISCLLSVEPEHRPGLAALLSTAALAPNVKRHAAVREAHLPGGGRVGHVDIPLIGYEGASKTKFSERPVFVDGGGRIVDEKALSSHDEKLLGARQRRQRQLAEKRGSSGATDPRAQAHDVGAAAPKASSSGGEAKSSLANSFDKPMNFGQGGVVGFLVQQQSSASGNPASSSNSSSSPGGPRPVDGGAAGGAGDVLPTQIC
jgi:serine/threonine protein kinase